MSDPDRLLTALGERIDQLSEAMDELAEAEAALKHWEALKAVEAQGEGMSVAASEKSVRALPLWKEMYLRVENSRTRVEELKHKVRLGHAYLDVYRTKSADNRAIKDRL